MRWQSRLLVALEQEFSFWFPYSRIDAEGGGVQKREKDVQNLGRVILQSASHAVWMVSYAPVKSLMLQGLLKRAGGVIMLLGVLLGNGEGRDLLVDVDANGERFFVL
jgi:hypothetical protein